MTTAREQARQAAEYVDAIVSPDIVSARELADAASNVWEPLAKMALYTLQSTRDRLKYWGKAHYEIDAVIESLKKALDDADVKADTAQGTLWDEG